MKERRVRSSLHSSYPYVSYPSTTYETVAPCVGCDGIDTQYVVGLNGQVPHDPVPWARAHAAIR